MITIIVLIILAGVAINLTLGENGILRRAEDTGKLSDEQAVLEKVETAVLQVQIEEVTETGRLTLQKLYENLESKDLNITLNQYVEGDKQLTGAYTLNGEAYSFIIDSEFNVIIGETEVEDPKPLSFGEITWISGKAEITIKSKISDDIEYQVNGTVDGNWTQGNTVTNLEHEDIVYARINDGTTITEIQQKEIKDETDPEEFEITVPEDDITYEAIKLSTTGTTDNQTGLATYSYVAATNSSEIVKEITNQTVKEYTIEGLSPETEYVVYMLAYDNAGNVRKSNEVTVTTETMPVAKMFGQYVNYPIDIDDNPNDYDWQIFYKEDDPDSPNYGATYIIPDYYVPYEKMTTSISNAKMKLYSGIYRVYWSSVPASQTIPTDVKTRFMYTDGSSSSSALNAVSTLLNSANWENDFVTNELLGKGGMAIGGPTIEMWMASWNKAYPTETLSTQISGWGYTMNGNTIMTLSDYAGYTTAPNVYFPTKSDDSDGTKKYLFACPGYGTDISVPAVWRYGNISVGDSRVFYNNYFVSDYAFGLRPVVYLPSTVTLTPDASTENLWNINY